MYTVECKNCGSYYESKVNRPGVCPDCKINARGKNNTKYRDKTYDRLAVYVPKGQREALKEYAKSNGMSTNEFVNNAIGLYIQHIEADKPKHKPEAEEEEPF